MDSTANTFIIDTRTDLLGAFTQHMVFARFYSDFCSKKLAISNRSSLGSLFVHDQQGFAYSEVSTDAREDHINYRKAIAAALKTCGGYASGSKTHNVGSTFDLQNKMIDVGLSKVINDGSIENIRADLLGSLPPTKMDTANLIAVHFRAGEVVNMEARYIHSSAYSNVLQHLRKEYPNHRIAIFTGTLPPPTLDDLAAFEGFEVHSSEPNALETWRIFIEADVFVMARSSFSHAPACLRLSSQKTYYSHFWHPKLDSWNTWFPTIHIS